MEIHGIKKDQPLSAEQEEKVKEIFSKYEKVLPKAVAH